MVSHQANFTTTGINRFVQCIHICLRRQCSRTYQSDHREPRESRSPPLFGLHRQRDSRTDGLHLPASRPPQRVLQAHGCRRKRNRRRHTCVPVEGRQRCRTRRLRLRWPRWLLVLAVRAHVTKGTAERITASAVFIHGTPIDVLGYHRPANTD